MGRSALDAFEFFLTCLAVDAQIGGRSCFESPDAYFYAAAFTVAVFVLVDFLEGFFDLGKQFAFAVPGAELHTYIAFLRGAITRVRVAAGIDFHVIDCTVDFLHEFETPSIEDLAKVRFLIGIHVAFAFLDIIRRYAVVRREVSRSATHVGRLAEGNVQINIHVIQGQLRRTFR